MAAYITQSNDTPWSLAVKYTKNGARWPELCAANPNLAKHPTYGCVFPKVGSTINLPDAWLPTGTLNISTSPTQTLITSSPGGVQAAFNAMFPGLAPSVPATVNLQVNTPAAQTAAAAAVPASASFTSGGGTAPAASLTVIPGNTTPAAPVKAGMFTGDNLKIMLIVGSVLALGVVAYSTITKDKDGAPASGRTASLRKNGRRRHRKMRRNNSYTTYMARQKAMKKARRPMTKPAAEKEFKQSVMPHVPSGDKPAMREAWNNFTDDLHRQGRISDKQVNEWGHPSFVKNARRHRR